MSHCHDGCGLYSNDCTICRIYTNSAIAQDVLESHGIGVKLHIHESRRFVNCIFRQVHILLYDCRFITLVPSYSHFQLLLVVALGMASDFWRVAVIGAIAAKLGEEQVAVFNTSYRIMWIVLTAVNSMATASGINISIRLGKLDATGAKQAGHVGALMSLVFLILVFGLVVWKIRALGRIFTNDESFLDII